MEMSPRADLKRVCRSCFEPHRDRDPMGGAVRSKANRERWQGILETTHRTSRRYEQTRRACITSSFRAICARTRSPSDNRDEEVGATLAGDDYLGEPESLPYLQAGAVRPLQMCLRASSRERIP